MQAPQGAAISGQLMNGCGGPPTNGPIWVRAGARNRTRRENMNKNSFVRYKLFGLLQSEALLDCFPDLLKAGSARQRSPIPSSYCHCPPPSHQPTLTLLRPQLCSSLVAFGPYVVTLNSHAHMTRRIHKSAAVTYMLQQPNGKRSEPEPPALPGPLTQPQNMALT